LIIATVLGVGDNNEVGNKVVGYLRLFPLLCRDGGRGGERDDGHGGGRGDGRVVDGDNNVVVHRWVVSPLVHGGDNEEEHISGVIDHFHSLHLRSHFLVNEDENVEEHK
jgi:hypothetical protein